MMKYWARITADQRKQPLRKHLQGVAKLTCEVLPDGLQQVGYYAGLWHDLGKYRGVWQDYLQGKGSKQVHAAQGAMFALQWALQADPDWIPAIAYVIAGHHTGLRDRDYFDRSLPQLAKGWETARDKAIQEINGFIPESLPEIDRPPLKREFAIRMLFSALVDSDRIDAASFDQNSTPSGFDASGIEAKINFVPERLDKEKSPIDQLRNDFAQTCIEKGSEPKGLYRLTGVCGIGKTKSSLRWGLIHQKTHQMRGILYVAPLKVILEETAQVYRDLLGSENVLEHHSGYEPIPQEVRNYKLDTERWDKPYIVTSGVQFYESLFANRPGQCRKLHQLRDRIILIDEAQTIPLHLAVPILEVLETLVADWGCSVVLMSATQPAFDRLKLCDRAQDIIAREQVAEQFRQLERVTYRFVYDSSWTWRDLVEDLDKGDISQGLIVVNTTKLAREGYQELCDRYPGDSFHLSTRMCPAHRLQVLTEIKQRLTHLRPCYLVSTPLIEAGVNVDFPRVYRQLAPFDSIIQTAGRCNRHGRLNPQDAIATVFDFAENHSPPNYISRIKITKTVLNNFDDPLGEDILDAIAQYFRKLYNKHRAGGYDIQKLRQKYNFPEVAKRFQVIEDDYAASVVVAWGEGEALIEELAQKEALSQGDWRRVQAYSATVPKKHSAIECLDNGLNIWRGNYHEETGCEV